jgi:hypothetical protein
MFDRGVNIEIRGGEGLAAPVSLRGRKQKR